MTAQTIIYGALHSQCIEDYGELKDHSSSNKCSNINIIIMHTTINNSMSNIIRLLVWDEARTKNNINFHKTNFNFFYNYYLLLLLTIF